jgi:hypothetical protein
VRSYPVEIEFVCANTLKPTIYGIGKKGYGIIALKGYSAVASAGRFSGA